MFADAVAVFPEVSLPVNETDADVTAGFPLGIWKRNTQFDPE